MSEECKTDYHEEIQEELKRREESKKSLKEREQYKNLVQDNVIIWKSEDADYILILTNYQLVYILSIDSICVGGD